MFIKKLVPRGPRGNPWRGQERQLIARLAVQARCAEVGFPVPSDVEPCTVRWDVRDDGFVYRLAFVHIFAEVVIPNGDLTGKANAIGGHMIMAGVEKSISPSSAGRPSVVAVVEVTYDKEADAAYVYFTEPRERPSVSHMYACDPVRVGGMVNLDFDEGGQLVGVEVLAASSKLPRYLLDAAVRIDVEDQRRG
jgi:uncharacterized protein YuzE